MAKKHGKKAGRKRSRRRGLRGELSAQGSHYGERMNRLDAEREAAGWVSMTSAPSPARVAASETRAENRGCKAPKGKVCVDASVAKRGKVLREGCKKGRVKGTYICTEKALSAHAAGKFRRRAHKAGKGVRTASWKSAVNKLTGQFKPGCAYSFRLRQPICKTKKTKRAA